MIYLYFLCVPFIIIFATVSDGSSINSCAHIIPQSPAVQLYTNLTAFCILNQTCLQEHNYKVNSNELYWEVYTKGIPESQYTIINETVSSVTFQPTTSNSLTCNINVHGQIKTTLHGIFFTLGLPPEKPENLSCICYNGEKLTCTWNPGRPTLMPTTYTLKQSWRERLQPNCSSGKVNNSCTLSSPNFQTYIDTTLWVEAVNELGEAESDRITLDIITIVKPHPPQIVRVVSAKELQKALKIEWNNPMQYVQMKYNLRYRTKDSTEWEEVSPNDINSHRTSYTLQDLQPYTDYVISLRCKQQDDKGFWSEWSKEYIATTPESTPSQGPEFWRKINDADTNGNRVVWLTWKDLQSHANGKILGYTVAVKNATKAIDAFILNDTSNNITVSKDSCEVTITAYNSYGVSPASTLIIPPASKQVTQPAEIAVKAFPKDGKLWVEWTAPRKRVAGYVIEWCGNSESMDCSIEWQREPSSKVGAFLRGDLKPYAYYLIKVYPLYKDGVERPKYVAAYLQQKAPEVGPTVHTTVEKKRAVLTWKPVPLEKRNGFITNYTLKYKPKNGPEKYVIINATQTEHTLTSLTGDTIYTVSVTANTEKGGTEGPSFTFSTHRFETAEVETIVVSSCIGSIAVILVGCFLFFYKRDLIKKHIWPSVPDPSKSNIAQWSPQTPTRHESKSHPFQDGSFTDVSVVEITADEKKPYNEEDLKSVDPMKNTTSEGLSSGIGGSSCMSSQQLSVSDRDEVESAQNTSSTVQYSSVIISGYRGQQPTAVVPPIFSRSESTQPLLDSEERPDELQVLEVEVAHSVIPNQYFKQNCAQENGGGLQPLHQDHAPTRIQEQSAQSLAGLSHEDHLQEYKAGHNGNSVSQSSASQMDIASDKLKSYLPQTVKRGGYMPQ